MRPWKATLILCVCVITIAVTAVGAPVSKMWVGFSYVYAKNGGSAEGGAALGVLGVIDGALMGAAFGSLFGPGVGTAVGIGVGL